MNIELELNITINMLMDHPDNEPNSEFADRIDSLIDLRQEFSLQGVSKRSKLLFAFEEYWNTNNCDGENFGNVVDRFLANNCG